MPQKISSFKTIIMSVGLVLLTFLWPQAVFADGGGTQPFTTTYRVTFDAVWSQATHPHPNGPASFPNNPHFSRLTGGTHNENVTFWELGGTASSQMEGMAENGSLIQDDVNAAIGAGHALAVLGGQGGGVHNIPSSPGSATIDSFTVTKDFPLVTLVTMLAPSPDWFVGVSGLSMLEGQNGQWRRSLVVPLLPYDSGTDAGVDYESSNSDNDEPISSLAGTYPFTTTTNPTDPIGTFTFTRINYSDLHLNKSVTPQTEVAPQSAVTYTVVLSNSGDTAAAGAIFTDTLPVDLTFARWITQPAGASESNNQITWTGPVPDGANVVFSYVATYTGSASGQTVTNQAQFSHSSASGTNSGQANAGFIAQSMVMTDTIPVDPNATETQTVSAAGGEVTIEIPPNVLPANAAALKYTNLGLTPSTGVTTGLPAPPTFGFVFKLNLFDAGDNEIDNPTFASPLTVTTMYSQTLIDLQNIDEDKLQVFFYDEDNNQWETLAVVNRDTTNNKITFKVNHLTEFALVEVDLKKIYLPLMMK